MDDRRERIARARIYAICDADGLARMPLASVDVLQLREKHLRREELAAIATRARAACAEHSTLFIVNDDPDLACECGADGVHVGQDDMPVALAREVVGADMLVGLSTHSPAQIDAAQGVADYIGVGPVFATPTKPGRAAVGLELVRHAAAHARIPFFAIGGIDEHNIAAVRGAGAERIAVVRAIGDAADPAAAAERLREVFRVAAA